jgi:hypothetical protein
VTVRTSARRSGDATFSTFRTAAIGLTLAAVTGAVAVTAASPAAALPMPKMFGAKSDYYAGYKTVPAARFVAATFKVPALHCDRTPDTAVVPGVQLTTTRTVSSAGVVLDCDGTAANYAVQVSINGTLHGPMIRNAKAIRAGDVVTVKVATYGKKVTASVRVPKRNKVVSVTGKLVGAPVSSDILVNGVGPANAPLNVPDFGSLKFTNISLGGRSMNSADSASMFARIPLGRTVQISVSEPSANWRSFTATFESSTGDPVDPPVRPFAR